MNYTKLTRNKLVKIFLTLNEPLPITIRALEDVVTTNPRYANVKRMREYNAIVYFTKNKIDKEINLNSVKGETVPNTPLILSEGKYVLHARIVGYNDINTTYFANGVLLNSKLVTPYIPLINNVMFKKTDFKKNIIVKNINIDDIKEIKMNGKHYIIS